MPKCMVKEIPAEGWECIDILYDPPLQYTKDQKPSEVEVKLDTPEKSIFDFDWKSLISNDWGKSKESNNVMGGPILFHDGYYFMTDDQSKPIYQLKLKNGSIAELGIINENANGTLRVDYYNHDSTMNSILISTCEFILRNGKSTYGYAKSGYDYAMIPKEWIE